VKYKANKLLNLTANSARLLCVRYRSLSHKSRAELAAKLARRSVSATQKKFVTIQIFFSNMEEIIE